MHSIAFFGDPWLLDVEASSHSIGIKDEVYSRLITIPPTKVIGTSSSILGKGMVYITSSLLLENVLCYQISY